MYYCKINGVKTHATRHLFAAQIAAHCSVDMGIDSSCVSIVDDNDNIYPWSAV